MAADIPIRTFAAEQIASRLGRLVFEIRNCGQTLEPEAVHQLRVAIRRFNQSLRAFRSLLPQRPVRKIRKQTRRLMRRAGQVRNRDIALALLAQSKVSPRSALSTRLASARRQHQQTLAGLLQRYNKRDFSSRWRAALRMDRPAPQNGNQTQVAS